MKRQLTHDIGQSCRQVLQRQTLAKCDCRVRLRSLDAKYSKQQSRTHRLYQKHKHTKHTTRKTKEKKMTSRRHLILKLLSFGAALSSVPVQGRLHSIRCGRVEESLIALSPSVFSGNVFVPEDGDAYDEAKSQYAAFNFPERVHPAVIVEAMRKRMFRPPSSSPTSVATQSHPDPEDTRALPYRHATVGASKSTSSTLTTRAYRETT